MLTPAAAHAEQTFDCVVDPAQQVRVGSPISGVVSQVMVRRGDTIAKGEPLARLESTIEEATVALDRIRAGATEEIEAHETRLALARNRLVRIEQLASGGHAPQDRLEELQTEVQIAERSVANEMLKKRIAELELARSEALLERRTIRSPVTGVVSERHLGPGEYTSQDSAIVSLVDLDPLHVETFVPVPLWGKIALGTEAQVRLENPVGGLYTAEVIVVDRVFDAASATFGVRLKLDNPDGRLPAGLRCTVSFAVEADAARVE